ncbi:lim and transglutaminase domain protein ltd-1-like isoform X2 [Mercenaria mercenaria]|uniref:lim and transglutaminase domain protein ltd-1-like isoform X2 n=1 Tax=Mercenaria mercenaria TaxID=6596 RepID=UPI00234F07FE|nr:lim and transglutaminase domain protein ltd-1-like isoform X2 [Mercenaria mercenaria]
MGCVNSRTAPIEDVDYKNVEDTNPDYPPAYIPDSTKAEIYDKDVNRDIQQKIAAMPKGTDGTYTSLLKYLSTGLTKETHHVTAIYLWMKDQGYDSASLDMVKDGDTPREYMKMIKDDRGDLTTFFTILCRRSGIPCNIISGLGKNETYFIGAPENSMQTKWAAVFADEEWHLIHIEWSMQRGAGSSDDVETEASDFFFLTDPDVFSTFCHPEDFNWQLLDQPISKKEFLSFPYYNPHFFLMHSSVLAPKSGTARAMNGKLDIEIAFPKRQIDNIEVNSFAYFIGESNEIENRNTKVDILDKYVFVNRKPSKFIFEVTLPKAGRYLFDIYGGYRDKMVEKAKTPGKGLQRLCQFRIISDKHFEEGEVEALPDSQENGWGPGPHCRSLGLVPLTHFESCIYIKPGEYRDLWFRMERDLDVTCQLTHNYLPVYELVEQVECATGDNEVQVRVHVPEEGQYALKIYCREAGSKVFHEACVYLIRQREKSRLPEKHRDKMLRNRLEHNIKNHTSERALQDAIEVFRCYTVPDHGEIKQGEEKLKQYWEVKKELRSAIKGRNINVVNKWLARAKKSKYHQDLQEDITEAERLQDNLTKMKGHMHPMAKMDPHTIIEIRNYKRPPKIVHDVMSSTYLLLGEQRDDLQDWEEIQYLMGKQGSESLQKRVISRRPEDVHIEIAEESDSLIQPYSIDKCRTVSNGICTFYKWNKHFIKEVRQRDLEERQRLEAERQHSDNEILDEVNDLSRSSRPKNREPVKFEGRGEPYEVEKEENGVKEENDIDKKGHDTKGEYDELEKKHEFIMSPTRPPEGKQSSPVSYAGWKPSDIS